MQISQQTELTTSQEPLNFNISSLKLKLNKKDSLIYLTEKKAYTPIASCVYEHIINSSALTDSEKLYYIIADCLALVNLKLGGKREIKLSGKIWAAKLGWCRTTIVEMQKSLEKKGYFDRVKGKNENKQDHRNIITPTMPDDIFNILEAAANKADDILPFDTSKDSKECKRSYLDRAKLFIPINYQLLLLVFSNSKINSAQKITWLDFYIKSYKLYLANLKSNKNISEKNKYDFYFFATLKELTNAYSCDYKCLSKNITILEKQGFLKRKQLHINKNKKDQEQIEQTHQDRYDYSLWFFSLSLPAELILQLKCVKDRATSKFNDEKNKADSCNNEITDNNNDIADYDIVEEDVLTDDTQNSEYNYDEEEYVDDVINQLNNGLEINNLVDDNNNNSCSSDNSLINSSSFNFYNNYLYIDTSFKPLDSCINSSCVGINLNFSADLPLSNNLAFDTSVTNSSIDNCSLKSDSNFISDSGIAYFGQHYNIYYLAKNFKSTLHGNYKVAFNKFLNNFDFNDNKIKRIIIKKKDFSIRTYLIKDIIKKLPKSKIDKARKFAYSIFSKNLAKGYAATLDKYELARQFIFHIGNWKPTKSGSLSQEQQIDLALATAWKAVTNGTWQIPYNWAKASILDLEYQAYKREYQEIGLIPHDLKTLENDVCKLFGYPFFDLEKRITESSHRIQDEDKKLLPAIIQDEYDYNTNFNNYDSNLDSSEIDMIEQSNSKDITIKQSYNSEFLNNFELVEELKRQGYFETKFSEDGMTFKTNLVNNQKYLAVLNNIKVDNEDIYLTLKLSKTTIHDYGNHIVIDSNNRILLT